MSKTCRKLKKFKEVLIESEKINPVETELCPHGQLSGICKVCLETDEGKSKQAEISEDAKEVGSEIARNLEKETGIKPYDVLMVLGAGFQGPIKKEEGKAPLEQKNPGWLINKEFRMRLIAAAQLYLEGRTRLICVTGGPALSEKWKEYGPLADLAKRFLTKKFEIPEEDILMENVSDATHGNLAHGLRQLYKQHIPVGSIAILSTNYHLNRAREMAERTGIQADMIPAETQLLERSPHYRKFVANWLEYAQKAGLEANEMAKIKDEEYWDKRSAIFTTPLNEPVPSVDISQDIAATAKRLAESGAEGVQTNTF